MTELRIQWIYNNSDRYNYLVVASCYVFVLNERTQSNENLSFQSFWESHVKGFNNEQTDEQLIKWGFQNFHIIALINKTLFNFGLKSRKTIYNLFEAVVTKIPHSKEIEFYKRGEIDVNAYKWLFLWFDFDFILTYFEKVSLMWQHISVPIIESYFFSWVMSREIHIFILRNCVYTYEAVKRFGSLAWTTQAKLTSTSIWNILHFSISFDIWHNLNNSKVKVSQ